MAWKTKPIGTPPGSPARLCGRQRASGLVTTQVSPVGAVPAALKLVKDAVVFVQGTQLASKVLVDLNESTGRSEGRLRARRGRVHAAASPGGSRQAGSPC